MPPRAPLAADRCQRATRHAPPPAGALFAGTVSGVFEPDRPVLLVFGGSQGARKLNAAVEAVGANMIAEGWQVLHAIGPKNDDQHITDLPHYTTIPYIDRMDLAYAIADAAITR